MDKFCDCFILMPALSYVGSDGCIVLLVQDSDCTKRVSLSNDLYLTTMLSGVRVGVGVSVYFIFLQFLFTMMSCQIVSSYIALVGCLITAQVARVFDSFMHSSFMPSKINL